MIPLPRILAKRCAMLSTRFRRFQLPICWKGDIKNFAGWVSSQEVKALAPRLALDVMFGTWGKSVGVWLTAVAAVTLPRVTCIASEFHFDRDTFAFANQTVFEYHEGHPSLRRGSSVRRDMYKRHCFVLCRTAMQFKKFARFELVQLNIGHGWPSYFRISNARMIFQHSARYQEETHACLNAALARGQLFVGFLTTFPRLSINHSLLVYKRKSFSPNPGVETYFAYDPNHPESPRELTWSPHTHSFSYQKDWDFVGGYVRVYQVYGKLLQYFVIPSVVEESLNCLLPCADQNSSKRCLDFARHDTRLTPMPENPSPPKPGPPTPMPPPEPLPPNPPPVPPVGR